MTRDEIVPRGPVFVSYRHRDGAENAAAAAWLLRAAGIPVWHDQSDLPPGDTNERLSEALARGLSGGLLLVTPDIARSSVVRTIEVPKLLALEKDPVFVFAVGNTVRLPDNRLDYGAPDSLLGMPRGTLGRLKQHGADSRDGLAKIAREIVLHRVARLAGASADPGVLHVSVQTRAIPHANDMDEADLSIRIRPATAGRLPSSDGLLDLMQALPLLPEAVSVRAPRTVRVTGGAHLTVAFALGSALPSTLVRAVEVEGTNDAVWQTGTVSTPAASAALTYVEGQGAGEVKLRGAEKHVFAYIDLLPDLSNSAYMRLLTERPNFDAWLHVRPIAGGPLDPATAGPLVTEVASRLRRLSQEHDNADLHLALRAPFPVAVLLGRLLNTIRVTAYEWDHAPDGDTDARPRYVPALDVAATTANGPISAVLLPTP